MNTQPFHEWWPVCRHTHRHAMQFGMHACSYIVYDINLFMTSLTRWNILTNSIIADTNRTSAGITLIVTGKIINGSTDMQSANDAGFSTDAATGTGDSCLQSIFGSGATPCSTITGAEQLNTTDKTNKVLAVLVVSKWINIRNTISNNSGTDATV